MGEGDDIIFNTEPLSYIDANISTKNKEQIKRKSNISKTTEEWIAKKKLQRSQSVKINRSEEANVFDEYLKSQYTPIRYKNSIKSSTSSEISYSPRYTNQSSVYKKDTEIWVNKRKELNEQEKLRRQSKTIEPKEMPLISISSYSKHIDRIRNRQLNEKPRIEKCPVKPLKITIPQPPALTCYTKEFQNKSSISEITKEEVIKVKQQMISSLLTTQSNIFIIQSF